MNLDLINSSKLDSDITEKFSNFRALGIGKPSAKQVTKMVAKGKTAKIEKLVSKGKINPAQVRPSSNISRTNANVGIVNPVRPAASRVAPVTNVQQNTFTQSGTSSGQQPAYQDSSSNNVASDNSYAPTQQSSPSTSSTQQSSPSNSASSLQSSQSQSASSSPTNNGSQSTGDGSQSTDTGSSSTDTGDGSANENTGNTNSVTAPSKGFLGMSKNVLIFGGIGVLIVGFFVVKSIKGK
jgi:hypothetical protein